MSETIEGFKDLKKLRQEQSRKRLDDALAESHDFAEWCREKGLQLSLHNDGQHWKMTSRIGLGFFDWWPSSVKMHFRKVPRYADKRPPRGKHVNNIEEAKQFILKHLNEKKEAPDAKDSD